MDSLKSHNRDKARYLQSVVLVLWLFILVSCATQHELRILHMNDFHGTAAAYKPYGSTEMQGGLAYLAQRAEELRKEKPTLLLAAGDMIQGNNWTNLFQGKSSIEAMNAMSFDAMVLGNHEFDFGQQALKQRISEAAFPVLGANIAGFDMAKTYVIKKIDGLKVAVIGVISEDTPITTHPAIVAGLQFFPPQDIVRRYVAELRNRTDLIVVLSHIGIEADKQLANTVDGIDVIVGGHSHTKIDKPIQMGKTYIAQAFEEGKALGVIDLTVKGGKVIQIDGRLEAVKPSGKQDAKVEAIVANYQQKVDALMNAVIGESLVDLDGSNVRIQETNLGDFIADIMRKTSGADAAVINGGAIRTSIKKGPIRVGDVYNIVPFANYIVAVKMTGQQLRDTLEHAVSAVERKDGRFPQVSGVTFTFNPGNPVGSRIKEIVVGGSPVILDKEYVVATNDFIAAGGDGFKAFGEAVKSSRDYSNIGGALRAEKLVYNDSSKWIKDVVVAYIRELKEISPKTEGRIREVK